MNAVFEKLNQSVKSAGKGYWLPGVLVAALLLSYLLFKGDSQEARATFADAERIPGQAAQAGGFGNTRSLEPVSPYPYAHLEQPPAPATGITPLAVASEPIWAEHNQRLLDLEANVSALKQETKGLKEQLSQLQAKQEANKETEPSAPGNPHPAVKTAESPVAVTATQTSARLASRKHFSSKRLKKPRHKTTQPQNFHLNAPIVVEAVNSWGNDKRVVVRDPKGRGLKHLRVGDDLGGWAIEGTQGKDVILQNSRGRALLKIPDKEFAQ